MSAVRKTYLTDEAGELRVPMREVELATGDRVVLYDTSGPYTDESLRTDVRVGLPPLRRPWNEGRASGETQLSWARRGEITREMEFIALREGVPAEKVRDEVAAGRAVIPANRNHPNTKPMVTG